MKNFKKDMLLFFLLMCYLICISHIYAHDDKYCNIYVPSDYEIYGEDEGFLMAAKMPTEEYLNGRMISYRIFPNKKLYNMEQIKNFIYSLEDSKNYTNISVKAFSRYQAIYFEQKLEDEKLALVYYAIPTDNNLLLISLGATSGKQDLENEEFTNLLNNLVIKDSTNNINLTKTDILNLNTRNEVSNISINNKKLILFICIFVVGLIILSLIIGFIIYSLKKEKINKKANIDNKK